MANLVYKSYAQNEIALFPQTLEEMMHANHRARVVNAVIDRLDISAKEDRYKAGGTSIYHPRILPKRSEYEGHFWKMGGRNSYSKTDTPRS